MRLLPAALVLLLLAACGSSKSTPAATADTAAAKDAATGADVALPTPAAPDCNPIVGVGCMSGIPTAFYERSDPTTATKIRLDLAASSMPLSGTGVALAPAEWNRRDGFSPNAPTVVLMDRPVDPKLLADETRPQDSLNADSATILLDAATGKRIAHLAEIDRNAPAGSTRQALILRPWTPPQENQRIVVALTDKLLGTDGKPFARTETFQRLIDGKKTGYPRIDDNFADWQKDLDLLDKAGIAKTHLLAAWHYDTASTAWTHGVALDARDQLIAAVGDKGLGYKITMIEVDPKYVDKFPNLPKPADDPKVVVAPMHGDLAMRVRATFTTPLFLTTQGPDATLNYDGNGPKVKQNGVMDRDFVMLVPPTVVAKGGMAPLLLYGHGLLRGGCVEGCVKPGDAEFFPHLVHGLGVVAVATDWWGLSQADFGTAVSVTNDFNLMPRITDKLVQAAVQPIALTRIVRSALLMDPLLAVGSKTDAKPLADVNADLIYYGNSLGGIMGTTMTSMHPDLKRMVMNVPGCTWSLLLNRSSDFKAFLTIVQGNYPDLFDQQIIFALTQSLWDLSDPVNFADHSVTNPFPNTQPGRHALWTMSWGDAQVPNLSTGILNRVAGVPLLTPALQEWFTSLTTATLPFVGTGVFVQWDSKRGTYPPGNALPPDDNGAHLATRWMPEFQQMIWQFLLGNGTVDPRYCLQGGRDTDGKLPCDLTQPIPDKEVDMPSIITPPVAPIP